jgi:hypothetical protein
MTFHAADFNASRPFVVRTDFGMKFRVDVFILIIFKHVYCEFLGGETRD